MQCLLDGKYRSAKQVAHILGVTTQAITDLRIKTRTTNIKHLNKSKLLYRLATNAHDELLNYLLDDNNFDDMQRQKGAVQLNKAKAPKELPRHRGISTIGSTRLAQELFMLKPQECLTYQHQKVICHFMRLQKGYLVQFDTSHAISDSQLELMNQQVEVSVLYINENGASRVSFSTKTLKLPNDATVAVAQLDRLLAIYRSL